MRFVAIDVETANADMASICSIGVATFESGKLVDEWHELIDPEDHFDAMNVRIHGLTAQHVHASPTFRVAFPRIEQSLRNALVVTHTHFDRGALHQATRRAGLEMFSCSWLDTSRVARRTWSDCAQRGYGLTDLSKRIGFTFKHHNALEDAKACGSILLAALEITGLDLASIILRAQGSISASVEHSAASTERDGNIEGKLFGEVIVFTGALTLSRREAADLAAAAGCEVSAGVNKKTTVLVVGDQDARNLAGHEKSNKHRKAEEMAAQGHPIRVIREADFRNLIALN